MVEIRIPGLDHSLSTDGDWVETPNYHGLSKYKDYVKRTNSSRKGKGRSVGDTGALPLWDGMASR